MPPRSKVKALPAKVKEWLDSALIENNFSGYELLSAELEKRGYQIGKSALHRYGQTFEDRLSSLSMATEQAKAVVAAAPDDEGAVNEALMRLVQDKLFNLLMMSEGDKIDLPKVARAVADLGRATVLQKKWQTEVRAKAQAAIETVTEQCRAAGVSPETLESITQAIYGIAP